MYKVAFLLKEFSDPSFAVQIYQTHRVGGRVLPSTDPTDDRNAWPDSRGLLYPDPTETHAF